MHRSSLSQIHSFSVVTLIFMLSVVASGCAFSPVERPVVEIGQATPNRYFDLPKSDLYEICKVTAQNMGYSLIFEDPANGVIRTGLKQVTISGNANCGTWNGVQINGFADSAIEIRIKSLGEQKSIAEVDTRFATRFLGRNLYGMVTRDETYRCTSQGQLENQYFSSLSVLAEHWKRAGSRASTEAPTTSPPQPATSEANASTPTPANEPMKDETSSQDAKLQKLFTLKAMGLMSESEFEAEKAKIEKAR